MKIRKQKLFEQASNDAICAGLKISQNPRRSARRVGVSPESETERAMSAKGGVVNHCMKKYKGSKAFQHRDNSQLHRR